MQMTLQALQNDPSPRVKEIFVENIKEANAKEEKPKEPGYYISEEEAAVIDLELIKKEIEQEVTVKVTQMPIGMKIDEIEP